MTILKIESKSELVIFGWMFRKSTCKQSVMTMLTDPAKIQIAQQADYSPVTTCQFLLRGEIDEVEIVTLWLDIADLNLDLPFLVMNAATT